MALALWTSGGLAIGSRCVRQKIAGHFPDYIPHPQNAINKELCQRITRATTALTSFDEADGNQRKELEEFAPRFCSPVLRLRPPELESVAAYVAVERSRRPSASSGSARCNKRTRKTAAPTNNVGVNVVARNVMCNTAVRKNKSTTRSIYAD